MNHAALKAELAEDPAGLGYAGKTREQKEALLNALARTVAGDVAVGRLHQMLDNMVTAQGIPVWELIEAHAADQDATGIACRAAIRLRSARADYPPVNTRSAVMQAQLAILAAAEILTGEQAATITAAGDVVASRAEELGLGRVTAGDVEQAEALP